MKEKKPAPRAIWPIGLAIGAVVLGVALLGGVVAVALVYFVRELPQQQDGPPPVADVTESPEVIRLLPLINAEHDAIAGTWIVDPEVMEVQQNGAATLRIPIAAPAEYQLTMQVTRLSGSNTFGIGLVTSKSQVVACLDAHEGSRHTGLELLDRAYVAENEARRMGGHLAIGRTVTVTAIVGGSAIRVLCDGEEVLSWKGDLSRLSLSPDTDPRLVDSLFLTAVNSGFRIEALYLYPTGELPNTSNGLTWIREYDASSEACSFDVGPGFDPARDWTLSFEVKIDARETERRQIIFWDSKEFPNGRIAVFQLEDEIVGSIQANSGMYTQLETRLLKHDVGRWLPVLFHYRASDKSIRLILDGTEIAETKTDVALRKGEKMPITIGAGARRTDHRFTGAVRRIRFGNYGDVEFRQPLLQ